MKRLLLILLLGIFSRFSAQDFSMAWSEKTRFDNRVDGWPDEMIGKNGTYIYVKFSNFAFRRKKKQKRIKILAYTTKDMSLGAVAELKGYNDKYDALHYDKTIIANDHVFVFWRKPKKKNNGYDLMVESYAVNLKKEIKLSKLIDCKSDKEEDEYITILSSKKVKNKFVVMKELDPSKSNGKIKLEYKVYNADFTISNSGLVELPIALKERKGLFGKSKGYEASRLEFELSDDGKIYVQQQVSLTDEEIKAAKKNESLVYTAVTQINPSNNRMQHYVMRFTGKSTYRYKPVFSSEGVKLYGFFSDLSKDPKGNDLHGIFVVSIDNADFAKSATKFNYFTKKFLDQLYINDKEDRKKGGVFKSKKAKESNLESISGNYVVEYYVNEGKDLVLFCSKMHSYAIQRCSGSGASRQCVTEFYCDKNNVTAFKFNEKGDILWASNLDRRMTYKTPTLMDVYDVKVIYDKSNYYVTYGSMFDINATKKNFTSVKGRKHGMNYLEYAVFIKRSGDYKKNEYEVNAPGTPKRERKFIRNDAIDVFDNVMYPYSGRGHLKWGYYFTLLVPPVFYAMILSGNHYKGNGYFGTLKLRN